MKTHTFTLILVGVAERTSARADTLDAATGGGIGETDIPHIFEMFRRLHGPDLPGSGIGLATVKRIVERLGGEIHAKSLGPGKGSVFSVTMKILSDPLTSGL